jgi:hypothetical protein
LQPGDQLLAFNGVALDRLASSVVEALVARAEDDGPLEMLIRPIDYTKVTSTPMIEGQLIRKLVYQPGGKKMSRRPWRLFYATIRGDVLTFSSAPRTTEGEGAGEAESKEAESKGLSMKLRGCLCEVAHTYTKRDNVFRLMMEDGADCLLQAESEEDMEAWVTAVQSCSEVGDSGGGSGNSGGGSPSAGRNRSPSRPAAAHRRTLSNEGVAAKGHRRVLSDGGRAASASINSPLGQSPSTAACNEKRPETFRRRLSMKIRQSIRRTSRGSSGSTAVKDLRGGPALTLSVVTACERYGTDVPPVISRLVEEIERRGLEEEGMYRLSGAHSQVQQLHRLFNKPGVLFDQLDLTDEGAWNIHSLCGVVKGYIRNLSEPLLTSQAYSEWVESCKETDEQERCRQQRVLARALPATHLATLRYLMNHLNRVAESFEMNKMKIRNLAIVFGPTVVQPGGGVEPSLADMAHQCRIVEQLLTNHRQLLAPPPGRRTPPPGSRLAAVVSGGVDGGGGSGGDGDAAAVEPPKLKKADPSDAFGALFKAASAAALTPVAAPILSSAVVPPALGLLENAAVALPHTLRLPASGSREIGGPMPGSLVHVGGRAVSNPNDDEFVTDSEEDSELDIDDEAVFGITDLDAVTISVDAPLVARQKDWATNQESVEDVELNSPSLSPQTLLSIEQLDSLRVDRGLRGLHNPVAAAAERETRHAASSPNSSSLSTSRRGSHELHEVDGVLRGADGFGSEIATGGVAGKGKRLSRRDSDTEAGTLV